MAFPAALITSIIIWSLLGRKLPDISYKIFLIPKNYSRVRCLLETVLFVAALLVANHPAINFVLYKIIIKQLKISCFH